MMANLPEPSSVTRYTYKASLIGAAQQFELTDAGLSWRFAGRSGVWPYADIAAIRLSYRPVSMQSHRFRADITHVSRARVAILSTSWQTAALMTSQDDDYRAFIVELHARMARAGSSASLSGGLAPNTYVIAVAFVAFLAIAMAALLMRSLATGELAGALFLVGFTALFGWQVGGFIRRNRPLSYGFGQMPQALLP